MLRVILYFFSVFLIGGTSIFAQGVYFQKGEGGFTARAAIHGLNDGHGFGAGLYYTFWGLGDIGFEVSDSRYLSSEEYRPVEKSIRISSRMSFVLVRDREGLVPFGLSGSFGFLVGNNEYDLDRFNDGFTSDRNNGYGALVLGLTFYRNYGNTGHPAWQPFINLESRTYAENNDPENSVRFTAGITNYIPVTTLSLAMEITPSYMRERENWAISLTLGLCLRTAYTDPGQKSRHPRNEQNDQW